MFYVLELLIFSKDCAKSTIISNFVALLKQINDMKTTISPKRLPSWRRIMLLMAVVMTAGTAAAKSYDSPDTIVVARDGTGEFRTVSGAIEVCRAFMDYHKVIYVNYHSPVVAEH